MQVAELYKQNDKEDFDNNFLKRLSNNFNIHLLLTLGGKDIGKEKCQRKNFQSIWRCQNEVKASMRRQVLSDVVKGYFLVLIESGRSPLKVMKSSLHHNKIVQFLIQGKSQSKWHIKYRGLGVVVIKLSSKFKDLSI